MGFRCSRWRCLKELKMREFNYWFFNKENNEWRYITHNQDNITAEDCILVSRLVDEVFFIEWLD